MWCGGESDIFYGVTGGGNDVGRTIQKTNQLNYIFKARACLLPQVYSRPFVVVFMVNALVYVRWC